MKLVVDKASLVSVADAIREKGNTAESLEFPNGFVDGINAIESGGGGTEEIENIIDQSGVLDSTDGTATEKVEQLVDYKTVWNSATQISFSLSVAERIDVYLDFKYLNGNALFRNALNLKYIKGVNLSECVDIRYMISGTAVETIEMPLNLSKTTQAGAAFATTHLKEIRFVKETIKVSIGFEFCSLLSEESIQSIIDGLATVETAQTLTLNATVKAKLTDEQKATITNKNWNLA